MVSCISLPQVHNNNIVITNFCINSVPIEYTKVQGFGKITVKYY